MKTAFCILLSLTALHLHAQDVIVKKDGSTILAKVLEVDETNIKYKKHSNQSGPTYTISVGNVMAINYKNGEKDTFGDNTSSTISTNTTTNNKSSQRLVKKSADSRNAEILKFYDRVYQPTVKVKRKSKASKKALVVFGVKKSSVMSNDDVEIMFEKHANNVYNIIITNKTDRTIYIDKGNCFKQQDNEEAFCYYENAEQTTVNFGGGSGASLGLGSVAGVLGVGGTIGQLAGGVGVGGGSSHSVSTTYQQQRVVAIPPYGHKRLSEEKSVQTKKETYFTLAQYKTINSAEHFTRGTYNKYGGDYYNDILPIILKKGIVNEGQVKTFQEEELPWKRTYYLTYSTEEDFRTYSTLHFELYIREIIGTKQAWWISASSYSREKYMDGLTDNSLFVGGKLN